MSDKPEVQSEDLKKEVEEIRQLIVTDPALDRDNKDKYSLRQLVVVALNGLFHRGAEITKLTTEKQVLEERVRELEKYQDMLVNHYSYQEQQKEITRLKAKNADLKEGSNSIMCVYCGFKAKKDANVMTDHIVFECEKRPTSIVNLEKVLKDCEGFEKTIQELELANQLAETKIDTITCALAEAREILESVVCVDRECEAGDECYSENAKGFVKSNQPALRASEEMKGLRKVVEAAKDKDRRGYDYYTKIDEALEAYERGKV